MKPNKLIWQMYPANLLVLLAAIAAITWYLSVVLQEFYLHEAELDLEARANLIKSRVGDFIDRGDDQGLRAFCKDSGRASGTRITVIDKEGVVLADSNEDSEVMDNHRQRPEIVRAYAGKRGRSLRFSTTLQEKLLYIAIPLTSPLDRLAAAGSGGDEVRMVIRMSVRVIVKSGVRGIILSR